MNDITVVVTACARPDLLRQTLDSFYKQTNFSGLAIVIEDSGLQGINDSIKKDFQSRKIEWIDSPERQGQIKSIDTAYQKVKTRYIFHLEDDWFMDSPGVLEESLAILEDPRYTHVSAVMCRAVGEGGYQRDPQDPNLLTCWGSWGFYSFNPGLRRVSDYTKHFGTFASVVEYNYERPALSEMKINNRFQELGYRMALTSKGYVRHIGNDRHVGPPQKILAGPAVGKPQTCNPQVWLCMIVKNENHVIQDSLASVLPFVDAYAITDTGSTDGTQDTIRKFFENAKKPGSVFQNEFVDFGTSRTQAFRNCESLCKAGDYMLVIDADDLIQCEVAKAAAELKELLSKRPECIQVQFSSSASYNRGQIFRAHANWAYHGVLHEYASNGKTNPEIVWTSVRWVSRRLGSRNRDSQKYMKDALVLERALEKEPDNERYVFYLAQSYKDAGRHEEAIKWYTKRYEMRRWVQEAYYSAYQIAKLTKSKDWAWKAHELCPQRIESLYTYIEHCRCTSSWSQELFAMALYASSVLKPKETQLFLEEDIYDWKIHDELSIVAYYTQHKDVSLQACQKLLAEKKYPPSRESRIRANMKFSETYTK